MSQDIEGRNTIDPKYQGSYCKVTLNTIYHIRTLMPTVAAGRPALCQLRSHVTIRAPAGDVEDEASSCGDAGCQVYVPVYQTMGFLNYGSLEAHGT